MYLLKLALRPWRLALWSQIFSAIAVGVLLLLGGFLFWMQHGLKSVVTRMQGEQVITAYLDANFPTQDETKLLESVRGIFGGARKGLEVQLVNAPQFVSALKGQYPDLGRELEDLGQEMSQIIPRYISVTGVFSDSVLQKIKTLPGIESAESSKDRYRNIVGAFSAIRWIARILLVGLGLALFTGLIHLTRMNAYLHQDALTLLKFWGAGNGTLAGPGLISGCFVGLVGGAIACFGWQTVGLGLIVHVKSFSQILRGMPGLSYHLAWVLFLLGGVVGVIAGGFGSLSSTFYAKQERRLG